MDAIKINTTEMNMETTIINFPHAINAPEMELQIVPWVNQPYELNQRNRKANAYSAACRRKAKHEDMWCALSALSVFAGIIAAYFLLCLI